MEIPDGTTAPVSFGFGAMAKFEEITRQRYVDFEARMVENKATMGEMLDYFLSAFMNGARQAGINPDDSRFQTREDVADLLDEYPEMLERLTSTAAKSTNAIENANDKKKSSARQKANPKAKK